MGVMHISPDAKWMKGKSAEHIANANAVRAFCLALQKKRQCKTPEEHEAMIPELHKLAAAADRIYYPD